MEASQLERIERATGKNSEILAALVERVAGIQGEMVEVKEHLAKTNGQIAKNTEFRTRAQVLAAVAIFLWVSVFIPIVLIAVNVVST